MKNFLQEFHLHFLQKLIAEQIFFFIRSVNWYSIGIR